jgi:subtilase family serine protease
MNISINTRVRRRLHGRHFYHWRLCRFESLEPRQVLSASVDLADLTAQVLSSTKTLAGGTTLLPSSAFTPAQIRQAYGVNSITLAGGKKADGSGTTIAIVDPGNDPTIVPDLAAFDSKFGISAPPNFKVVNQFGSTNPATLPVSDPYTSEEIALDVEWAHAIAPGASILLVEVNDPFSPFSFGSLDPTEMFIGNQYARSQPNVVVVSNSWGGGEEFGEGATDPIFTTPSGHAGVQFVFSAGDSGGPASYPSASPNVLSVGGTVLKLSGGNYSSETVWNLASGSEEGAGGGGQSAALVDDGSGNISDVFPLESVPNYQTGLTDGFGHPLTGRGTPDISYDAVNYPIYDSFSFGAATPWGVVNGTSAGAPQVSALIAIADQGRALVGKGPLSNVQSIIYNKSFASDFTDITNGNNDFFGDGLGITGNKAVAGYDLASGLGTPKANLLIAGLVAFNGTATVSSNHPAVSSTFSFGILFATAPKILAVDSGPAEGATALSLISVDNSAATSSSSDNLPQGQFSAATVNGNSTAREADLFLFDDSSPLQFATDSQADSSYLAHRSHENHNAAADNSNADLDTFFAEV